MAYLNIFKKIMISSSLFIMGCDEPIIIDNKYDDIKLEIKNQNWTQVIKVSEARLITTPDDFFALESIVKANYFLTNFPESEKWALKTIKINKKSELSYYYYGLIQSQRMDKDTTILTYRKLYELSSLMLYEFSNSDGVRQLLPTQDGWPVVVENSRGGQRNGISPPKSLGGGAKCPSVLSDHIRNNVRWMVELRVAIDSTGMPVESRCVSESSDVGDLYAAWAQTWRYTPASVGGKPIPCVWHFRVPVTKVMISVS